MRNVLMIAFIITLLCLCGCLLKIHKSKRYISRYLIKMLWCAVISVIANMIQVQSSTEVICNIAYAVFFIATDWILYYWFLFSVEFCCFEQNWHHCNQVFKGIILIDVAALIANPIFGHMYSCRIKEIAGTIFYQYDMHPLFYVHLFIVYFLAFFSFIHLLIRSANCPKMYRIKYINAFIVALVVPGLDVIHLMLDTVVDYMIFGFASAAIALYYCIEYIPRALLNHVMLHTVSGMKDGIVIFDNEKHCIYENQSASEILDMDGISKFKYYTVFCEWCKKHQLNYEEDFAYEWIRTKKDSTKDYLKMNYQILRDARNLPIGSFLLVQNRTKEANRLLKERYKANFDSLTGIYNRSFFYEQTRKMLQEHQDTEFVMVCSDIKDFKLINELFGSDKGDEVLKQQAQLMKIYVEHNCIVYGRITEDKFALCMPKARFREEIFIDNILKMGKQFTNHIYRMHIYIGVYEIRDINEPVAVMFDKAHMAIETIKGEYSKIVAYYNTELMEKHLHEKLMVSGFEEALNTNQFKMYLQPQCNIEGQVLGAEALVRWEKPGEGLVSPGQFLPAFERAGIIYKLDEFIWEEAAKLLKKWKDEGDETSYISVNISVKDLYYTDVYAVFTHLIQKYGISAKNLKLEITETVLATEFAESINLIERLHAEGFTIEIDDFGSGYSSLNTLKDIYADILKIDMGFLRETENKQRSKDILNMVIMLAKKLNMPVITEGVEKEEQLNLLKEMGCEIFQGYYFSKPIPVREFEEKYRVRK